jgi:hypothetical protein
MRVFIASKKYLQVLMPCFEASNATTLINKEGLYCCNHYKLIFMKPLKKDQKYEP